MKYLIIAVAISCLQVVLTGNLVAQPAMKLGEQSFYAGREGTEQEFEEAFLAAVDFDRFRTHLERLCQEPHPAGSEANERVMQYISEVMMNAGLSVEIFPYDIYLPIGQGTSTIELVTPIRKPLNQQEYIVEEDVYSKHPDLKKGWNAWSGSGDVTAEVVYVNYGRKADFQKLQKMGISLEGKIAIARYGGNFRGYKAKFAEEHGAIGLIIYTDPSDSGYMRGLPYPEGKQYNESSVQRGSLLTLDYSGDPLTPFEPALPVNGDVKIERLDPEDVDLHTIPVTPIGYGAAKEILELMTGRAVPGGWQGGLPFTYRVEGGSELKVRLMVEQEKGITRINNVVGTLTGSEQPEEWVILGSHYDAWSFGSADPNSGTALLLCLAETLGKMNRMGMQPKRSIKIAHWDAEEHGLIGSSEWVEQFKGELKSKAVAYINLDAAVTGPKFSAAASPSLKGLIEASTRRIPYPDSTKSLYEVWQGSSKTGNAETIRSLGGGSDHVGFYMHAGIPSMAVGSGGGYLYHTNYDNLHFYEKFCDPSFKMGGMMEQLTGLITLRLANNGILPYQVGQYSIDFHENLEISIKEIQKLGGDSTSLAKTSAAALSLSRTSKEVWNSLQNFALSRYAPPSKNTLLNQKMKSLEASFHYKDGLPFSPWYQSLFSSSDPYSGYSSWMLPGIRYFIERGDLDGLSEWDAIYANALIQLESQLNGILELSR